jgi:hypothetical protein
MEKELIDKINRKCPHDQGVFTEPYGIDVSIKEPVIYCRIETGGSHGRSCWGGELRHYTEKPPKDRMKVLDLVLEELYPDIKYLQYRDLQSLIRDNYDSDCDYYGNSTDYLIEYIVLSELEKLIKQWNE